MSGTAAAETEELEPDEASEGGERTVVLLPPAALRVASSREPVNFADGIRSELTLLARIRRHEDEVATRPVVAARSLVWRLLVVTVVAAAILGAGLALTVLSLLGDGLRPNPYVALSVLAVGGVLVATVARVLSGGD